MSKKGGSTTVNSSPDPATQQRIDQLWGAANGAANTTLPGVDPLTSQAQGYFGNTAAAGNVGAQALAGDPTAFARFANPYDQNVVDSYMGDAAHLRGQTFNDLDSQATQNGAYGGSRLDVAKGVAGANIARDTGAQIAGLRQGGFNTAMGNAYNAANLGLTASGQLAGAGDYNRQVALSQNPQLRQYAAYLQAMGATPNGTTTTQTQQNGKSPLNGAIGGASIGSSFGPWGAGIGAAAGGLMSLFG